MSNKRCSWLIDSIRIYGHYTLKELLRWTICAFRVFNPHQGSSVKQIYIERLLLRCIHHLNLTKQQIVVTDCNVKPKPVDAKVGPTTGTLSVICLVVKRVANNLDLSPKVYINSSVKTTMYIYQAKHRHTESKM